MNLKRERPPLFEVELSYWCFWCLREHIRWKVELELQVDWPLELCGARDFRRCSGLGAVFFLVLYILVYFSALRFYRCFVIFLNCGIFPRRRQWSFAYVVNSNFLMSVFCRADEWLCYARLPRSAPNLWNGVSTLLRWLQGSTAFNLQRSECVLVPAYL